MQKDLPPSRALASRVVFAALEALRDNDGELPVKRVLEEVKKRVELDEYAKERYEKTGYVRWQSLLHFFTIDCVKAGYLVKKQGRWFLTPEGAEAMKLGPVGLHWAAGEAYRKWRAETPRAKKVEETEEGPPEDTVTLDQITQIAADGLEQAVRSKNAYEFQDLVAALLRGMGYYTPFVAPRGKDGGIDIIAYRDPLGTSTPRIKVQVKHREAAATVMEMRQLMGLLQADGDVGIFISTGGFSSDAKSTAQQSSVHVELIDLPRLLSLWQDFYSRLPDEDKNHLPLVPVYFLEPEE